MVAVDIKEIVKLAPKLLSLPSKNIWSSYDESADVLYINFKKPCHAEDSELTEDNIVIRYQKGEIVGITILNAKKRMELV